MKAVDFKKYNMGGNFLIKFNKTGYDSFIDFLKGVCIFLVILTHCLSSSLEKYTLFELWGRPAIPIFFLIQVFHVYKHGFDFHFPKFYKLWNRILKPYLIIQVIIAAVLILFAPNISLTDYANHIIKWGGYGPGEYYPWVYLQFAVLIPMVAPIFKQLNWWQSLIVFIVVSQLFEILFCVINVPDWPYYSLCFVRYTFLIYLGFIMTTKGLVINWLTLIISILSLMVTIYFCFSGTNLSPFFVTNTQWKYCHWPCYIYIAYFFLYGLKMAYYFISKNEKVQSFIKKMGVYSYDIYLFQMMYFVTFGNVLRKVLSMTISDEVIKNIIFVSTQIRALKNYI